MPRRGDLKETRNDHQVATARRFFEQGQIAVAFNEEELVQKLNHLESMQGMGRISPEASPQLIGTIRAFIRGEDVILQIRKKDECIDSHYELG